jgi:hypothetical protein
MVALGRFDAISDTTNALPIMRGRKIVQTRAEDPSDRLTMEPTRSATT